MINGFKAPKEPAVYSSAMRALTGDFENTHLETLNAVHMDFFADLFGNGATARFMTTLTCAGSRKLIHCCRNPY